MPPRYAYWTILIDDKPTAFRAREREELQPTIVQLQRKNANVTMRWFARGKLWESREAERDDFQAQKLAAIAPRDRRAERPEGSEKRGSDWRPGGAHKDPRDRFKKRNRPERAWSEKDPATQRDRDKPGYVARERKPWTDEPAGGPPRSDRPWSKKPADSSSGRLPGRSSSDPRASGGGWIGKPSDRSGPPRGDRPPAHRSSSNSRPSGGGWSDKPSGEGKRPWTPKPPHGSDRDREARRSSSSSRPSEGGPSDRPWQTKPTGPRAQRKPWIPKASGDAPRGDRPWNNKPPSGPPRGDRPWSAKPPTGAPRGDRPWSNKPPGGPPRGDRPPAGRSSSDSRPSGGGWSAKPPSSAPRGDRPWSGKPPAAGAKRPWSGKPRDQDRKPFTPRGPRPGGASADRPPRKRRDDEPTED